MADCLIMWFRCQFGNGASSLQLSLLLCFDFVAMDAKSDALGSGLNGSSSSSTVLSSTSGSSQTQNLSIIAIWLNCINYAQWAKFVVIYFIAKRQYKFLVDNSIGCKEVGEVKYED